MSKYKILVADDEPELRDLLVSELLDRGHSVFTAANGFEAIGMARGQEFDGVLTDIRMPNGDGRYVLHNIRAELKQQSIVYLLTGYADISAAEAFHLGANGLIFKPYLMANLFDRFESAIDRRGHFSSVNKVEGHPQLTLDKTHQIFWGTGGFSVITNPVPWLLDSLIIVQVPTAEGSTNVEGALRFRTVHKNKHVLGFELIAVERTFEKSLSSLLNKSTMSFIPSPDTTA